MIFAKGHGTQNDFVLLPDLDAKLTLTPAVVAAPSAVWLSTSATRTWPVSILR